MKLVFLPSTVADLRWLKTYYVSVFPEGGAKADRQFLAVQALLKANPLIGHPSDKVDGAREHHMLRTPFTFIYRIREDRIEVLRVLDTRADWTGEG
jgi:plasmid stabilization system protein ParE